MLPSSKGSEEKYFATRYFKLIPNAVLAFFMICLFMAPKCFAENPTKHNPGAKLELGDEYKEHSRPSSSGNSSSGKVNSNQKKDRNLLVSGLLYIPNRLLDILDIFRVDVGVGPAVGAVARITPHGQVGARLMMPLSLRLGLRGRKSPVFIEHTSEMGVGPLYLDSPQREPTPLEIGIGADLLIFGAYFGISIDSIFDAITGFAGFDISEDDL
ncbi:MAG TPA: hypothetical protein PKA63_01705 [Oligoflexia bacterium]|nr:hypothetical protein [Oligoflexia bacterium]HMP47365.1 hypothetical protein [Oligoflexia bacterium]